MNIVKIDYGSPDWRQARILRYELFFEKHGLPKSILDDEIDEKSSHFGLKKGGKLIAYGRLTAFNNQLFKISQMVVHRENQGGGYGTLLLKQLIHEATLQNATTIELNARLTAVAFYSKHGFVEEGVVFNSKLTNIPHIKMQKLRVK